MVDDRLVGEVLLLAVPGPKVFRGREMGEMVLLASCEVELDDGGAVGGVGEREAEDCCVVFGLLEAVGRVFVSGFGFDDREWEIEGVTKEVVGTLVWAASGGETLRNDAARREKPLFNDGVGSLSQPAF